MTTDINKENDFEAKLRVTNCPNKDEVLAKINEWIKESSNKKDIYKIVHETNSLLILSFGLYIDLANIILRKLKLLQLGDKEYKDMKSTVGVTITNSPQKLDTSTITSKYYADAENYRNKVLEINKKIDFNLNPSKKKIKPLQGLELLNEHHNYERPRNISCSRSTLLNQVKKESLFLDHGPYLDPYEEYKKKVRQNRELWLNRKGFNRFVNKASVEEFEHKYTIKNYVQESPSIFPHEFKFREEHKEKWLGKKNFC